MQENGGETSQTEETTAKALESGWVQHIQETERESHNEHGEEWNEMRWETIPHVAIGPPIFFFFFEAKEKHTHTTHKNPNCRIHNPSTRTELELRRC